MKLLRASLLCLVLAACGSDADRLGVAAQCDAKNACQKNDDFELVCLTEFKGGYCGLKGCAKNADCPDDAICVAHEGANYCFRVCAEKAECNANRDPANEANCSSSIARVDGGKQKACIPPSGS